jgi:hypothetical protein
LGENARFVTSGTSSSMIEIGSEVVGIEIVGTSGVPHKHSSLKKVRFVREGTACNFGRFLSVRMRSEGGRKPE